jgi:sensor domain CHASE-containing protein
MKISKKLMWPITAGFILTAALFIPLFRSALISSFSGIEASRAQSSAYRVVNFINSEADNLQAKAMDYSRWDSTYNYIQAPYQSYAASAFSDYSSFQKLGINQIVI